MNFLSNINVISFIDTFYGPTDAWNWKKSEQIDIDVMSEGISKSDFVYRRDLAAKFCVRTFTIGLMIFGAYYGMKKNASNAFGQILKFDFVINLVNKSPILYARAGVISTIVLGGISSLIIEKLNKQINKSI